MSQITLSQCEVCKKRADDKYTMLGWVTTTGRVSIAKGRKNGNTGDAKTGYADASDRDFCSLKCYLEWLKKI